MQDLSPKPQISSSKSQILQATPWNLVFGTWNRGKAELAIGNRVYELGEANLGFKTSNL